MATSTQHYLRGPRHLKRTQKTPEAAPTWKSFDPDIARWRDIITPATKNQLEAERAAGTLTKLTTKEAADAVTAALKAATDAAVARAQARGTRC